MGGQRQEVLKDKTARSVPKSRNGGEALQSGLLHSWALGQQKCNIRERKCNVQIHLSAVPSPPLPTGRPTRPWPPLPPHR